MATVTLTLFDCYPDDLAKGVHAFNSHVFKAVLSNTAPVATNTVLANITQIANGGGYTAGGFVVTISSVTSASGLTKIIPTDTTFTASGAATNSYRYIIWYNDTATGDPLIGYVDLGSSRTLPDGDDLLLDYSAANGLIQLDNV